MFPVGTIRDEFPVKDWVIGIKIDGRTKVYPVSALPGAKDRVIVDTFAEIDLRITLGETRSNIRVENRRSDELIPHVKLYWFAWQAFYPDTQVYVSR